jgi:hypothetical protein
VGLNIIPEGIHDRQIVVSLFRWMAPNIRDAERTRTSSCAFADRIAIAAKKEFLAHAEHVRFKEHQTVLAAFLVHDPEPDQLQVRCTAQTIS